MNRYVRGLVEFQRYTGCRPGEAVVVRRCDIDTRGEAWVYKPATHKTAWRGKTRTILIGPRAQAVLREFFTPDATEYLFNPRKAMDELRAGRSATRKTPRYPSHMKRNEEKRKANPRRTPAERYTTGAYNVSVAAACERAFPPPPPLAKRGDESNTRWRARLTVEQRAELARWVAGHRYSVNQLRHTAATKVRAAFGIEAAQSVLGHSKPDTTLIYAERSELLASSVAMKLG
ncbi:hypothetical protein [Gemmata sp.]|uniref:hypothetical protein n=1 Tax=Gemmata sp. TaxID=1914242 RepID=UPI003F725016